MGKDWEPSKQQSSEIGEHEVLKQVQLIFVSVETIKINVIRPACKAQSTLRQYSDKG